MHVAGSPKSKDYYIHLQIYPEFRRIHRFSINIDSI